jgi:hypothetical protein
MNRGKAKLHIRDANAERMETRWEVKGKKEEVKMSN